jgi:hypothetical protein
LAASSFCGARQAGAVAWIAAEFNPNVRFCDLGVAISQVSIKNYHMPAPDEYRRYADLCVDLAKTVDDKAERTVILNIADQWRRIANLRTKRERLQETEI